MIIKLSPKSKPYITGDCYALSFIIYPYFWLIIGIILAVSVINLTSMTELALTYENALLRLLNLIALTSSNVTVKKMNEESNKVISGKVRELGQERQQIYIEDIDWSKYSRSKIFVCLIN